MLEVGSKAPDFTLFDERGEEVRLSDFKGRQVILYFYPKDNSSGCTRQALSFKALFDEYQKRKVVVIGISKDSSKSHLNFKTKYDLPFILLSDPSHEVLEAYDVWKEKKLYGKVLMGTVRSTYVLDRAGVITKVFLKVDPDDNAKEVLEYLDNVTTSH